MKPLDLHFVGKLLVHRKKHVVHDQPSVLGVISDEGQFVGMQAKIERVDYSTGRWNSEVRFEM